MWGRKDGVPSPGEGAVLGSQAKTLPVGLCLPVQGMRTEQSTGGTREHHTEWALLRGGTQTVVSSLPHGVLHIYELGWGLKAWAPARWRGRPCQPECERVRMTPAST